MRAPFSAAFVGQTRETSQYLCLLDHLHVHARSMRHSGDGPVARSALQDYAVALVPLCCALGDLVDPTAAADPSTASIRVMRAPDFEGIEAEADVNANWSMREFSSSRVIDELYFIVCAHLERSITAAISVWNAIDAAFGHTPVTDVTDTATASPTLPSADEVRDLTRDAAGMCVVARAVIQHDVNGRTADEAARQLRRLTLALVAFVSDLMPALGAAYVLHTDFGAALRFAEGVRSIPCVAPDAVAALRITRAHWLRSALACAQLATPATEPGKACPALQMTYNTATAWTDACRKFHFRAASTYYATHGDIGTAIWCRACALEPAPRTVGRGGDTIPTVYTAAPALPIDLDGTADTTTTTTSSSHAAAAAAAAATGASATAIAKIRAILAPALVPWCPNGCPELKHVREDRMIGALIAQRNQMREFGCALSLEYHKESAHVNWDLPLPYLTALRTEIDPAPIDTLVVEHDDTESAMRVARAAFADAMALRLARVG